ncbi:MAG: Endoglucanase [Phycisphaerales bacterium]|nr:Endoglucanase [Phycisphaerales bacterium]
MRNDRRGVAIIYVIVALTAMAAFVSLAVDLGRVQLVKTQLQRVADAAARYGAQGAEAGNAVAWATANAQEQTVNGTTYTVTNGDIVTGNWANSTFTPAGTPLNAVKVTVGCTASRGTAVPLMFGTVIGKSTCDVHATSVAIFADNPNGGFIGLSNVTVKNNTFIGSYNSSKTHNPTHAGAGAKGAVGSNGAVTSGNNDTIQGNVLLGPSGSVSGFAISGTTMTQAGGIQAPSMPAYSPGTNPGSIPQNYTVSSTTTLTHGSYWFTSLTVSGTLSFDGPTILYVNGPVDLTGDLLAYNSTPSNLTIYQYGSNTFGSTAGSANNTNIIADVIAPNSDFTEKNNLYYYGRGFFKSIDTKNNADFYYDEAFGSAIGGKTITTVK